MKKVYQIKGNDLEALDYFAGMDIASGDIYGFDDPDAEIIWIWIGSNSIVEEQTVTQWFINKVNHGREEKPRVVTINQGAEPMLFRENWSINVINTNTPAFLDESEFDISDFNLYRVYTIKESWRRDNLEIEKVELSRSSLLSDDTYVLDKNEIIYCWIGKGASIEGRQLGLAVMQKLDGNRQIRPLQYTIHEGTEDAYEKRFYDALDKLEKIEPKSKTSTSVDESGSVNDLDDTGSPSITTVETSLGSTHGSVPNRLVRQDSTPDDTSTGKPPEGLVASRIKEIHQRTEERDSIIGESRNSLLSKSSDTSRPWEPQRPPASLPSVSTTPRSSTTTKAAPTPSSLTTPSSKEKSKRGVEDSSRQSKSSVLQDNTSSVKFGGAPVPELTELEEGPPRANDKSSAQSKNLHDVNKIENDQPSEPTKEMSLPSSSSQGDPTPVDLSLNRSQSEESNPKDTSQQSINAAEVSDKSPDLDAPIPDIETTDEISDGKTSKGNDSDE